MTRIPGRFLPISRVFFVPLWMESNAIPPSTNARKTTPLSLWHPNASTSPSVCPRTYRTGTAVFPLCPVPVGMEKTTSAAGRRAVVAPPRHAPPQNVPSYGSKQNLSGTRTTLKAPFPGRFSTLGVSFGESRIFRRRTTCFPPSQLRRCWEPSSGLPTEMPIL